MTRVVIDTSVLVHYLIRPGVAVRELIEKLWLTDQVMMVSAPELIQELEAVLARDYIRSLVAPEDAQALLGAIQAKAEILPALGDIPSYTRDRKDDKFVACAVSGNVSYLITLDKDLLVLGELQSVQFVTPFDFIAARRAS